MRSPIKKRSVSLGGHKTSVSLEAPFWQAFQEIAHERNVSVPALLVLVDDTRSGNLSSAVRLFVLEHYRACCAS
jgi:predicted DNA-binding ribbon-helix-helix protein